MELKNIIFDLGNVLVNVEYERFRNKIISQTGEDVYNSFFTGDAYRSLGYESGKMSTEDFVEICINKLGLSMKEEEFMAAFNDMFSEISPMSRIVKELSEDGNYNLYLLSNTSPLHFEYIRRNYTYINLLHKYALSYELKALKPDEEIYIKAIEFLNIEPEVTIFIDDLKENCESAEKCGIKSIQYDKNNHSGFENIFYKLIN